MKYAYNWKGFHDLNIHIAAGSDSPVESYQPLLNIYSAVTRKNPYEATDRSWMPEQRISVQQAVYAYTMGSAYATHEDHIKGSISKGKLADLVVLSDDIFTINPDLIKDIQVIKCFMGGDLAFEAA